MSEVAVIVPVRPPDLPLGRLPFSPAVRANGFVFVSGQASTDAAGGIVPDTFAGEMRRSMANLTGILAAAGLTLADVVQVRGYVGSAEDLAEYNHIYREYFADPFPARTTLVGCLGGVLKFEIDAVAVERG
jgi:2-iminobutanoate/2-iminopropanoate deaminase